MCWVIYKNKKLLQRPIISFLTFFIIMGMFGAVSWAKLSYVTVESSGSGVTPKEAIQSALIEALGMVNGMQMSAKERAAISSISTSKLSQGQQSEEEVNHEEYEQAVQTATKGVIKNYEVLSSGPDPYDQTRLYIKIRTTIAKYQVSKQANRNRIAVLPFRVSKQRDAEQINFAKNLSQGLVAYLTQTRRFAVLDRDFTKESNMELNSLNAPDVPVEEMARFGNRLGVDYIVVGQVNKAVIKQWYKVMASTGKKFPMATYGAVFDYRVIDIATGQVMFSQLYDNVKTRQGSIPTIGSISLQCTDIIGKRIVEGIFPIAVVSLSGKYLYLGQGGDTITNGQRYTLVQYGHRMVDPYTGESLGREEIPVGTIQIVDVQAKVSRAVIIKSQIDVASAFQPNRFIVRPESEKKLKANRPNSKSVRKSNKKSKQTSSASPTIMEKDNGDDW